MTSAPSVIMMTKIYQFYDKSKYFLELEPLKPLKLLKIIYCAPPPPQKKNKEKQTSSSLVNFLSVAVPSPS